MVAVHNSVAKKYIYVHFFNKKMLFIQQGCIQFIKSGSKDMYNVL